MNIKFIIFFFSLTISSINTDFYSKVYGINNFDLNSSFLLSSFNSISIIKCFTICSKNTDCFYISFQLNKCFICKLSFILFAKYTENGNSLIYQKKLSSTANLTNYWTFNGNVNDVIGNANLYDGVNAGLTFDRFGRSNSALSLSTGYYKVPPGVYFSGKELTIMAWVRVKSFSYKSRLIDFGNEEFNEYVVFSLSDGINGIPFIFFRSDNNDILDVSTNSLNLNQWQNLACVFTFPYYSIYIDGIEATRPGSKTNYISFSFSNLVRSSNFIGSSNWKSYGDQDADADFDDLKFFNRALTQTEIKFEMMFNL